MMRPTTASTATAPSTAAPTRSLSRCEGMGSTSPITSPQRHRLHGIQRRSCPHCFLQGHRSRFAHPGAGRTLACAREARTCASPSGTPRGARPADMELVSATPRARAAATIEA
jgi:hypothetical protein